MAYLLIVDDDLDFASAVSTVLSNKGYEIAIETDCAQALDRIRRQRPDAVILDVMFPENDKAGFEIARAIRREFGELPVLLLTAVNQSFPLGFSNKDLDPTWLPAVEFVEKPVDFAVLTAKISSILAAAKG
ncbi:MAG: response regulator [Pirellulales bacterium]|nr:response regulator [Pirellulales bacterium]